MRVETRLESTRRADKRAPRWRQSYATNYRSALVAITSRIDIVRGALKFSTSLDLLSQPYGLRPSASPGVTLLIAIFGGHLPAFHGASSAAAADLATEPRKLALQLNCSFLENPSNLVTHPRGDVKKNKRLELNTGARVFCAKNVKCA